MGDGLRGILVFVVRTTGMSSWKVCCISRVLKRTRGMNFGVVMGRWVWRLCCQGGVMVRMWGIKVSENL